jgi:hypothetical protein
MTSSLRTAFYDLGAFAGAGTRLVRYCDVFFNSECKQVCAGGHMHWAENRLVGTLEALLKLATKELLDGFLNAGNDLERWCAQQEVARRRPVRPVGPARE